MTDQLKFGSTLSTSAKMPRRALTKYGQYDELDFARGPTEIAKFQFPRHSETATVQGSRIITLPPNSTWKTGLHWHEEYVESVKVLKGKAKITIGARRGDVSPDSGVKLTAWYSWCGQRIQP